MRIFTNNTSVFIDNVIVNGVIKYDILTNGTYLLQVLDDQEYLNDGKDHDLLIIMSNNVCKRYRIKMMDSSIIMDDPGSIVKTCIIMRKL